MRNKKSADDYDRKVVRLRTGSAPGQQESEASYDIKITWFRDVHANVETADLVEDMLGIGGMYVIYGESGSGKTFFATDLGLHIALGWDWNGRHVERMGVIYCAMEGTLGVQNRIAAFKIEHELDGIDVPFGFVSVPLDLCGSDADANALADVIDTEASRLGVKVGLILMDTLARGMAGGNENAPDDMGALVRNGDLIRSRVDAALGWVHHSGKDSAKGARGHSSLRAATDTEIEITVDEAGAHIVRITKQREYECAGTFTFALKVVELGRNRRDKPVTSCVVDYGTDARPQNEGRNQTLTGHNRRALDVLTDLCAASGSSGRVGVPSNVLSVPAKAWRDQFFDRSMPAADDSAKYKAFKRASDYLINTSIVGMASGHVWVVRLAS